MSAKSLSKVNLRKSVIVSALKTLPVNRIAISAGWIKRKPKKIHLIPLIECILQTMLGNTVTYQSIAISLGFTSSDRVSRQAVFYRINAALVVCLRQISGHLLKHQIEKKPQITALFKSFNNVLIEDSSSFHAPDSLAHLYKGNFSRGKTKAVGKVDVIWNIKNGTIVKWVLKAFTYTDQKSSPDILNVIRKGDLVIRDLGYSVAEVFKKIMDAKAHFLSRYRQKQIVYDAKTSERFDLLKMLKKMKKLDMRIWLGEAKIPVRLVAIQLPRKVADERRRKAKKDRSQSANHNEEYMQLLSWAIYITSVDEEVWDPEDITRAYGMRWNIEMLFKSWKSCLNANPPVHHETTREFFFETYIHLILILVIVAQLPIYLNLLMRKQKSKDISLMKVSDFIVLALNSKYAIDLDDETFMYLAEYYGSHEKRKRKSMAHDLWNSKN